MDFLVFVGDELIADAGAKDLDAELGGGQVLPDIERALLGKQAGEQVSCEIKLGPNHPHPKLKGQTAIFKLTLKELKQRILPELDDEFAKDLGEFETLEELKTAVKQDLEKRLTDEADNKLAEALVAELVKNNPIEVPQSLVQQQNQATEQEMIAQARSKGQTVRQIPAELRARIHADSEIKVRAGLLMAEIAKRENIKIGEPQIEEGLKELAQQTGKNVAKLRAEYRDARKREMLIGMILENKVLDILQAKAKIEAPDQPAETT
jgi:trigger factor